jgi:hypothetical protein
MGSQQLFESRRLGRRVAIDDEVFTRLAEAASEVRSRETGGILIGRYAGSDLAHVEHATTAPGDSRSGWDWFERGTAGLEAILDEHWNAPTRRYYVGEWHYHPAPDGTPSPQDIDQMFQVASEGRYDCRQPILIIIALDDDRSWLVRVFLFTADDRVEELMAVPPAEESTATEPRA